MNRQTFAWGSSRNKLRQEERWIESLCIVGLLLAALVLFGINLGSLPLRDWDEGTVAQVAKEIWQDGTDSLDWLFPTLWGEPYMNKPPLVHGLIAFVYSLGGVNEWTTRLPGAMLTALSVPLLYGIGREIFATRTPALFSALIYLTLLPVVRHGRLAMLDGAVLCFGIVMIWCVLRSRRDLRWALGAGIGFGLICLTKGIMGLLLGAIALLFIVWDTPRLLTSVYLWIGVLIGSTPVIAWYASQWLHYGETFISTGIVDQSLRRVYAPVGDHSGPPWYYLLEILKYSWPWLFPCLYGLRLAWEHRNWSWAKLILVWSGVYFPVVSLMMTKLPWYIMPIYPALALAGGAKLAEVLNWPSYRSYPRAWMIVLGLLALAASLGCIYFGFIETTERYLMIILGSTALTMGVAAMLAVERDRQFIPVLFWGMYVSVLLFVSSPHWIWELNEAYPVKPVAAIIRLGTPLNQVVYTSFDYGRPSLNFYSDRQVIPATIEELKQHWFQSPQPFLLLDAKTLNELNLESAQTIGTAPPNWVLITKDTD
ncbi:MAG: ArnT family glycosyltransferase [Xenococcaceae cyanobacterium]